MKVHPECTNGLNVVCIFYKTEQIANHYKNKSTQNRNNI